MAAQTPQEIATNARCFQCIPEGMQLQALVYLFAQIAGVTDPQTIINGARCYSCIPPGMLLQALVYLAGQIAGGGIVGSGCVAQTTGDPEGVLVSDCSPALAVDPSNGAIYLFTGVAGTNTGWSFKV